MLEVSQPLVSHVERSGLTRKCEETLSSVLLGNEEY